MSLEVYVVSIFIDSLLPISKYILEDMWIETYTLDKVSQENSSFHFSQLVLQNQLHSLTNTLL